MRYDLRQTLAAATNMCVAWHLVECSCEQRHLCQLERKRARREFRRVTVFKHANEIIQFAGWMSAVPYRLAALLV